MAWIEEAAIGTSLDFPFVLLSEPQGRVVGYVAIRGKVSLQQQRIRETMEHGFQGSERK